ncbi:hypothetical protein CEP11_17580, partial [Cylindrospermopsis raciborskii S10]
YKFGSSMMSNLPQDAVGVMDRGFAGLNFIRELVQKDKYFVVRIKNNCKKEIMPYVRIMSADRLY